MNDKHYLDYALDDIEGEIWASIEGHEEYQVSNKGRVKSLARQYKLNSHSSIIMHERMMKFVMSNCGYLMVMISKRNTKTKNITAHRLVAKAFIPNPQDLREVNHINGIKWDNRVENLEWLSSSDNKKHGFKTGLYQPKLGESHSHARLTELQVLEIRERAKNGESGYSLAKIYGITQSHASAIITNKVWKHLLKAV
jgi:hypothetical protein